MSRLRAETMPAVTVPPRLNGLPMAMTHSPSRSLSESPNATALSGLSGLHAQQREIALGVLADQFGRELGAVVEDDVDLVGVGDDVIVGDDEAGRVDDEAGAERVDAARRALGAVAAALPPRRFLKNSSKNSSIGEPGGRSGMPLTRASTFCDVEMLTTASITCSATSAMFSGPRAAAGCAGSMTTAAVSAALPRRAAGIARDGETVKMARHGCQRS